MRILKFSLSLALILLFCSGCRPFMKVFYGISNPKVENRNSLLSFLKKKEMEDGNVLAVTFNQYPETIKLIENTLPEVMIFDREGNLIPYGDEAACNAAAFDFIELLDPETSYPGMKTGAFSKITTGLCDLEGHPVSLEISPENDFTVLIYWAKWNGKLNKDHVAVWEEQARQNQKSKIQVWKINMDLQEFWGEENLKKLSKN